VSNYPAEKDLFLKEGAQVMFVKNDWGENRRYFNGSILEENRFSGVHGRKRRKDHGRKHKTLSSSYL